MGAHKLKLHICLRERLFSVRVINTLNIVSILLPTAVWFKGSFVSWQSAQGPGAGESLASFAKG